MPQTSESCPFALAAIAYLKRNDFTDIYQMEEWLLFARDGDRKVYVWLGGLLVPRALIMRVKHLKARLDILAPNPDGHLRWMVNVLDEG